MTQVPGDADSIIGALQRVELAVRRVKARYTSKMTAEVFADELASEIASIIIGLTNANRI